MMVLAHLVAPLIGLAEQGRLPDRMLRAGMRNLLSERLRLLSQGSPEQRAEAFHEFLLESAAGPIACVPEKANAQHYEVPAEFFAAVLGEHRKYSCCWFETPEATLDQAEAAALRITCERAGLADGQQILELGCGWGSLSLWMARQYPGSRILALSNSHSQRAYIETQSRLRGLSNLEVRTCDINEFSTDRRFDRVVSVEMFEHVRNHRLLMQRIAGWLVPDGLLFVHIFCHRQFTYPFEDTGTASWMARCFFSGGVMPGHDLLLHCQQDLQLERVWDWDGRHYQRTANAWLARMDDHREAVERVLQATYGAEWKLWRQRWRMFFMACAELFGYRRGQEWYVSHYRFRRPQ